MKYTIDGHVVDADTLNTIIYYLEHPNEKSNRPALDRCLDDIDQHGKRQRITELLKALSIGGVKAHAR
ncbi:hypothetical protein [Limosilactobacillus fermentum]|uniref:hypothetical protein n=1 Tax=Limosilactobacillus fermentum TaxID=1613 RepID=UPI003D789B3E